MKNLKNKIIEAIERKYGVVGIPEVVLQNEMQIISKRVGVDENLIWSICNGDKSTLAKAEEKEVATFVAYELAKADQSFTSDIFCVIEKLPNIIVESKFLENVDGGKNLLSSKTFSEMSQKANDIALQKNGNPDLDSLSEDELIDYAIASINNDNSIEKRLEYVCYVLARLEKNKADGFLNDEEERLYDSLKGVILNADRAVDIATGIEYIKFVQKEDIDAISTLLRRAIATIISLEKR